MTRYEIAQPVLHPLYPWAPIGAAPDRTEAVALLDQWAQLLGKPAHVFRIRRVRGGTR